MSDFSDDCGGMKIEEQVCSLKLAKRLKELGVGQESSFYWGDHGDLNWFINSAEDKISGDISAFTVAELGEMLPAGVDGAILVIGHLRRGWVIQYRRDNSMSCETFDNSEADARAKMLIHLLQNKLMEARK